MQIIINAENGIFGRICSYSAKKALEGNEIIIVNSEKAIITGNKKDVIQKYRNLRAKGGHSKKGPKISKVSYKILKRGIRGMLPDHRKGIGKIAFKKIKCYDGIPKQFQEKEMIKIKSARNEKYISLKEIVERL